MQNFKQAKENFSQMKLKKKKLKLKNCLQMQFTKGDNKDATVSLSDKIYKMKTLKIKVQKRYA